MSYIKVRSGLQTAGKIGLAVGGARSFALRTFCPGYVTADRPSYGLGQILLREQRNRPERIATVFSKPSPSAWSRSVLPAACLWLPASRGQPAETVCPTFYLRTTWISNILGHFFPVTKILLPLAS